MKKFIAFGIVVLVHLSTLDQVNGQSSNITLGDQIGPVIYNGTIDIPAATRPWYQSMLGFFTRSPSPVQNVTYTFPPNNAVSCFFRFESFFKFNIFFFKTLNQFKKYNSSRCLITALHLSDVNTGGLMRIVGGGLHQSNVSINFTSKEGKPMRFIVEIRGFCIANVVNVQSSYATNTQAIPIYNSQSYGWINPSNESSIYNHTTDYPRMQNSTSPPANSTWWHFW